MQIDGLEEKDLEIRQEFYKLRGGDHGIEKTRVEIEMDQKFQEVVNKVMQKKGKESVPEKNTHFCFISKVNAE